MKYYILLLLIMSQNSFAEDYKYFGNWFFNDSEYLITIDEKNTKFEYFQEGYWQFSEVCLNTKIKSDQVSMNCDSAINSKMVIFYDAKNDEIKLMGGTTSDILQRAPKVTEDYLSGSWMVVGMDQYIPPIDTPFVLMEIYAMVQDDIDSNNFREIRIDTNNYDNSEGKNILIDENEKTFIVLVDYYHKSKLVDGFKYIEMIEDDFNGLYSYIYEVNKNQFIKVSPSGMREQYLRLSNDYVTELLNKGYMRDYKKEKMLN